MRPVSSATEDAWLACLSMNAFNITPTHEIEGLASCLDYFKALNDPAGSQIQEEYSKRFPGANLFTAGVGATGMYRGWKLWEAAVKEVRSVKREDVARALDHAKLADGPGGGCAMRR